MDLARACSASIDGTVATFICGRKHPRGAPKVFISRRKGARAARMDPVMHALLWILAAIAALTVAAVAHFAFWGWIYRVRPDSDALLTATCSDGWRLAVARFRPAASSNRPPVILCHGLGANRLNLCLPGAHSLAGFLRARGHEVFAVDLRGCGDSSKAPPHRARTWDFDDHVLRDAPAALELVLRETGQPRAFWVGHSMGGMIGLALAEGVHREKLAGVAALGSPTRWQFHRPVLGRLLSLSLALTWGKVSHSRWMVRVIAPYLGFFPLPLGDMAINPQNIALPLYRRVAYSVLADSSRAMLRQFASWFRRRAWDLRSPPTDLRAGLAQIQCPVLLVGGTLDVLAPPQAMEGTLEDLGSADKTMVLFGKARGDAQDYGHGDLIFGRCAPVEIFPEVARWIDSHAK